MTIERSFDVSFVAELALREKQIQQVYRPTIAVHKWFARRPGTLFRGLLLSEFGKGPVADTFFRANDLQGLLVVDPFMGGGTPLIEANRLGCDVVGCDINPMAHWIVRQTIEHLDLVSYQNAAKQLIQTLEQEIGSLYRTTCVECGSDDAQVKYFLWVKVKVCTYCKSDFDLFPGYLVAKNQRHPNNVFICSSCGGLNEASDRNAPGNCRHCDEALLLAGPAKRNRCTCPHCGKINKYSNGNDAPLKHRMIAIEYHCSRCRKFHRGRYFKVPDDNDLAKVDTSILKLRNLNSNFIPDDEIPSGDETDRLHRWGYSRYRQMFNERQLVGLELSCRLIAGSSDERVRGALATNLSDLLRYQNMLCRYDTMALKSLDIFSVHGFPVGLIQCESNLIGIAKPKGGNIGSGGWTNIIRKFTKAKTYCNSPFEIKFKEGKKIHVPISGEWIGGGNNGINKRKPRKVRLLCMDSAAIDLPNGSVDAVFTDPPYFGNVQYAELMDFCYVWLRRLVGSNEPEFDKPSTRNPNELTGNTTLDRGLDHFVNGLSLVFQRMAKALKSGAPLVFTYHHNQLEAYYAIAVAILDSGLTCSGSIPCPAEMRGSIHISGTASSIIDTIFVSRSTGSVPRKWVCTTPKEIAKLIQGDVNELRTAGLRPTQGDIRCIIYGHLARLAVWHLRRDWDASKPVSRKLALIAKKIEALGGLEGVKKSLPRDVTDFPRIQHFSLREDAATFGADDAISF